DGSSGATLSLVDRFDTLLRVGRGIASALTAENVYDAVQAGAAELLRTDGCTVVLVDEASSGDVTLSPLDGSSGFGVSERLVRQAAETKAVAAYAEGRGDPSMSMVLDPSKSALAAPVFVRGR